MVYGLWFRVNGLRFTVQGLGFMIHSLRLRLKGLGFPVWRVGFKVQGWGSKGLKVQSRGSIKVKNLQPV